jgi:catechol 2,3-dioxygenase-like lactoylglutathione lyase family enzyme
MISPVSETASPTGTVLHHIGMSVGDLDEALAFWRSFLGAEPRWRTVLDRPYVGRHVGYPGVHIDAALLDVPGGPVLELLEYRLADRRPNPDATANPGNVHLCLASDDASGLWARAVAAGACPIVPEGPVEIDAGPNRGGWAAYLRIHDGITLELIQPPAR